MKLFYALQRHRITSVFLAFRKAAATTAAACLLLAACAPGSDLPPLPMTQAGPYRLGTGEQVRIVIFGQEQLTGRFTVNDRGNISVPLLGPIPASGLTTSQLEANIADDLRDKKILVNPSVSVEVVTFRPVFILGEVVKPGQYPYEPGMTALTTVAIAGGFTYRAQTGYVSILRTINGHSFEGRAMRGTPLQPGDVVTVFERYF